MDGRVQIPGICGSGRMSIEFENSGNRVVAERRLSYRFYFMMLSCLVGQISQTNQEARHIMALT